MKNEVGALFDQTLPGEEPPSGFSSDDVVTAGRRRTRRHRAAYLGTGVAGVASVLALAFVLVPGADPAPVVPTGAADGGDVDATSAGPSPEEEPGGDGGPPEFDDGPATWDEAMAVADAFVAAVESQGVAVEPGNGSGAFELQYQTTVTEPKIDDNYFMGSVVTDGDTANLVSLTVYGNGDFGGDPNVQGSALAMYVYCNRAECVPTETSEGVLYTQTGITSERYPGSVGNVVAYVRDDGTLIVVDAHCGFEEPCAAAWSIERMVAVAEAIPDPATLFD